jgi:putative DNA-invertase from lambdoid prophage Rac
MVFAYIRVSNAMQKESADTQKYGILQFCDEKKIIVNDWVVETVSGTKKAGDRKLGDLLEKLNKGDSLIVAEISRLGRSILDVMTTLNLCMNKGVFVLTGKEKFQLDNSINSKVLAFAFGLAAEIERQLISVRTKEALQRKKSEGMVLGRVKGSISKSRLDGHESQITEFMTKGVSKASISKILGVHPGTLDSFIRTRNLLTSGKESAA